MNNITFGEFVRNNHISLNSAACMKDALEQYKEAVDRSDFEVWCLDMAAKYFEDDEDVVWVDDNTWIREGDVCGRDDNVLYGCEGWRWYTMFDIPECKTEMYCEGMNETEFTGGKISYENPLTKQWSDPYKYEYPEQYSYLYFGMRVKGNFDFEMKSMQIPGYNHGWDEESVEKEFKYAGLHDWAIAAAQEDFESEKAYVRAVLDREYLKERPEWGKAGLWLIGMFEKKVLWIENLAKLSHLCPDKGPFGILNATCGNYHLKISHYGFVMAYCGNTIATYWARTRVLEVRDKLTKHKGAIKGLCMDLVRKYNF